MAKKIFAFNLKMNKPDIDFNKYVALMEKAKDTVYVCAPTVYLGQINSAKKTLVFGAQNVSEFENGAHTGEISSKMLKECGCEVCIVGHSERRKNNFENSKNISQKIDMLFMENIMPIVCVGESKTMPFKKAVKVIKKQLDELQLFKYANKKIVVAYEPVWAIGTGKVPTTDFIFTMCAFIKNYLTNLNLNAKVLYGGSYNENNAKELNKISSVDGFLIGGASLKEKSVKAILKI